MSADAVGLTRVRVSLAVPFRTSRGDTSVRDVLFVRVVMDGTEGWGECAAQNDPTYTPEFTAAAHLVVRDHLAPALLAANRPPREAAAALAHVCGHPMAVAAVLTAVLDARLRREGVSLAAHLGATRTRVPAGIAVGLHRDPGALAATLERHRDAGYRRVKLKVTPAAAEDILGVARRTLGPDAVLVVDANGAYSPADAPLLAALASFDPACVEQPLPATLDTEDDLRAHAALARRIPVPVCLDESLTSVAKTRRALEMEACRVVCVKPGRLGGFEAARAVHDLAVEAGAAAWVGGMIETACGRAANAGLAALDGFTLPGDLPATADTWADEVGVPLTLDPDGFLQVPTHPGVAPPPDPDRLVALGAVTEWVGG